jgi:hypothetical protein
MLKYKTIEHKYYISRKIINKTQMGNMVRDKIIILHIKKNHKQDTNGEYGKR